jgi:hypothetical protein
MMDWWSEIEHGIVECLGSGGVMSPGALRRRVGISEDEANAFLCMLARERKVSIRLVGLHDERASQTARGAACLGEQAAASQQTAYAGGN